MNSGEQRSSEDTNLSEQYKLLEEIVYANKKQLNKISGEVKDVENGKNYERKYKFWNSGYCKFKKDCQFLHPEVICSEAFCLEKSCNKRHPKPCKKFAIGFCKFNDLCEFAHDKNLKTISEEYLDFDNFDHIDLEKNVIEQKRNPQKIVEYSCDKCDFKVISKAKLIMHENSTHKIIDLNKENNKEKLKSDDTQYIDYDNIDSDDETDEGITKNETIFSCDECEYTSHRKFNLTKHVKTCHKNDESKSSKRKRDNGDPQSRKKTKLIHKVGIKLKKKKFHVMNVLLKQAAKSLSKNTKKVHVLKI